MESVSFNARLIESFVSNSWRSRYQIIATAVKTHYREILLALGKRGMLCCFQVEILSLTIAGMA